MLSTRRLILLASALPVAAAISLVEAPQASAVSSSDGPATIAAAPDAARTTALQGLPEDDDYNRGWKQGFRQGMRDGRVDCKGGSRARHYRHSRAGVSMLSRGFAAGYDVGYARMCGR